MDDTNTFPELPESESHLPDELDLVSCQPENMEKSCQAEMVEESFFRYINRLRSTGTLCDCTLATTDGASFRVHKAIMALCSNYFRILYTNSLNDKKCSDSQKSRKFYLIPNISSSCLESIIIYAYEGVIDINENNVKELLPAADQFNVESLVLECVDFLLSNMTVENCIGIWGFGREYFIAKLKHEARRFILEHFTEIINTEEFLELKVNALKHILEDNALNVPSEFFVWIAIKRWYMHNYEKRLKYIPDLFPTLRMALLSANQIKQIMEDPRVYRSVQCRTYINVVAKYILDKVQDSSKDVEEINAISMFTPRHPYEIILATGGWTMGGPTNTLEVYDSHADLWKMIFADDFGTRAYHQTLRLGDHIYIIGGSTGQDYLNSCKRCHIKNLKFEEISPMHEERAFLSAAILNGKIYAIGGYNGNERLKTVEYYNEELNQWTYVSPMNEKRSDASASSLRNRIFVVGGFNGVDFLQTAECYFFEIDQWFYLSLMVKCRSGAGCVAMDDAVYAIGGFDGENRLSCVEKYCFFQSQWFASKPMKQPRSNFAIAVLENKIYVMGGYDDVFDHTKDQAECFDPAYPEWHSIASLNISRSGFSACTFPGVKNITPFLKDDRFRCRLKTTISSEDSIVINRIEAERIRSALDIAQFVFV